MPRRLAAKLLLACAAPAVLFGALELALRTAGAGGEPAEPPFPGFNLVPKELATGPAPMVKHPFRFYQPRPGMRGPFATDDLGLRGGRHPARHDNLFRVALLGDSCTMGFGCRLGDCFAGILEDRLRATAPHRDIDVVNAGCAGYSTYQNAVDLSERVLPLAPDALILCLTGWNDSHGAILMDDAGWGRRFAAEREGGALALLRRLALVRALELAFAPPPEATGAGDLADVMARVERGERPHGARVAPEDFTGNVRRMVERSRAAGATVLIALLPPTAASEERDPAPRAYLERARALAAELAVPVVDALPLLGLRDAAWYFDSVHPNEAGHRAIGESLHSAVLAACNERLRAPAPAVGGAPPTLASAAPARGSAFGDTELAVDGSGFADPERPRFLLGGEPLELLAVEGDGRARLLAGAAPPGPLELVVQTRAGSARLPRAFTAVGPSLEVVVERGAARATIRGRPGDSLKLFAASGRGDEARMFGRHFLLARGTLLPQVFEGTLDAAGAWSLAVPLPERPAGPDGAPLYLQALVEPATGHHPRVALYTDLVEARF